MTWQKGDNDAPESEVPPELVAHEADAETARVPIEPPAPPDADAPLTPDAPPPTAGIISAQPVGWTGPAADPGATPPAAGAPVVSWAAPAAQAGPVSITEGLVIAGVFTRLVAYTVDILFLGLINVAVQGALGFYGEGRDDGVSLLVGGVLVGLEFLYFVGLWTSGWHATLGMRLLKLRVLNAVNAGTLSINDAILRWIALSGAVSILTLVPGAARYLGLIAAVWVLVLLISTGTNRLHQGLHDRWARSVVVQPAPGGSGAAVATCLVILALVLFVFPILLLIFAGPALQDLLIQIGESV